MYIIYQRKGPYSYSDNKIVGVCKNKDKNILEKNLNENITPRLIDLERQRDCLKAKIKSLRESRQKIDKKDLSGELRHQIIKMEKEANKNIDKEIGTKQKNLAEVEKQITDEKRMPEFTFVQIQLITPDTEPQ